MIARMEHPLVFSALIFSDVFENAFCLWSLHRISLKRNVVSPVNDDIDATNNKRKSLNRRSSNVHSLTKELGGMSNDERLGTSLFIAATLLQRELVETMVPLQAILVMSILWIADVDSNSLTSSWKDDSDYEDMLMYVGIDFAVEMAVFTLTVAFLNHMFPEISVWRVLRGLVRTHTKSFIMMSVASWLVVLMFQSLYTGMDMTLKFGWLKCTSLSSSNSSGWLGGYDWSC